MIEHYIRGFEEELREIRHQIHENPELGLQEFKTSALVAEKLRQFFHFSFSRMLFAVTPKKRLNCWQK